VIEVTWTYTCDFCGQSAALTETWKAAMLEQLPRPWIPETVCGRIVCQTCKDLAIAALTTRKETV